MAIMIPERPKDSDLRSNEVSMFKALENLPNDYYVFHSFQIGQIYDNYYTEAEMDFLIFHPSKGIIDIEAKNGSVRYEEGQWYYENGKMMKHGGPIGQAKRNCYELKTAMELSGFPQLFERVRVVPAVWFPAISEKQLNTMTLSMDMPRQLVLTTEALATPEPYLDRIFSCKRFDGNETKLSKSDVKHLLNDILSPKLHLVPDVCSEVNLKKIVFRQLLRTQANVLDFLIEQRTAAINGVAGTGKTLIAIERARRLHNRNQQVLFLCFNKYLRDYLENAYGDELRGVKFYTMDGLACKLAGNEGDFNGSRSSRFKILANYLSDVYAGMPQKEKSDYLRRFRLAANIIVDEGQDLGQADIEENQILEKLSQIAQNAGGSFYIFYDRLQMIQSSQIPSVIKEADCKLTLYENCRNTENIAQTSFQLVLDRLPEMSKNVVIGNSPRMYFAENQSGVIFALDESISQLEKDGYHDIVILTMRTEAKSILADSDRIQEKENRFYYSGKYLFTTCRKFKGLQADCIILIDFDTETFDKDGRLLFYVGTSRARLELRIISTMSEDECRNILGKSDMSHNQSRRLTEARKARIQFGKKLKCVVKIITPKPVSSVL